MTRTFDPIKNHALLKLRRYLASFGSVMNGYEVTRIIQLAVREAYGLSGFFHKGHGYFHYTTVAHGRAVSVLSVSIVFENARSFQPPRYNLLPYNADKISASLLLLTWDRNTNLLTEIFNGPMPSQWRGKRINVESAARLGAEIKEPVVLGPEYELDANDRSIEDRELGDAGQTRREASASRRAEGEPRSSQSRNRESGSVGGSRATERQAKSQREGAETDDGDQKSDAKSEISGGPTGGGIGDERRDSAGGSSGGGGPSGGGPAGGGSGGDGTGDGGLGGEGPDEGPGGGLRQVIAHSILFSTDDAHLRALLDQI